MRIHCGGLLNSSLLSTYGDGAITSSFVEGLVFLHALHFVIAKHELIFVLVKGITTVVVLKHLLYAHLLTSSCGCCMGTGEDHHLSSKPHSWLCDLFSLSKNLLLRLILD